MNPVDAFAAARRQRMQDADKDLGPSVVAALSQWSSEGDWYSDLIDDASVLWLEVFEQEAPNADPERYMARFREMLGESLSQTTEPTNPPAPEQAHRITYWLSTATINNATFEGNKAHGGAGMRWATMLDSSVRETHRRTNGQVQDRDGTFDVGGYDLHYPGEPVGPPEIWINCRCILVPARVEGALTVAAPIIAAITDEVAVDIEDDELPVDEPEDDEELITEIPVHGVAVIEGKPTGDGRNFEAGAVSWGDLPQPIGFEFESSHGGDNSRVAIIGRIDSFEKFDNGDYTEVRWRGVIHPGKEYAPQALEGIIDGSYGGLSIIADSMVLNMDATEAAYDAAAPGSVPTQHISEARIRRFDMVPTPAYQEAYVALGSEFPEEMDVTALAAALVADCGCDIAQDEAERRVRVALGRPDEDDNPDVEVGYDKVVDLTELSDEELAAYKAMTPDEQDAWAEERNLVLIASAFAPGTKDGPGWITHPIPTSRIRRYWVRGKGAAKIRWGVPGDFNRCRRQLAKYVQNPDWLAGLCANMHKEAIGVWPGQEAGGRGRHSTEGIAMSLVAAGPSVKPAAFFKNPMLDGPTPLTITEEGHIFGHLAAWGVCHIGIQDVCTVAPRSTTNYASYRTGTVVTEEGRIPVGHITMGTGHASIRANARDAVAHYDNTGYVVADVVAGEDAHGIFISGLVRPTATQEQIDALQASALSGDWRGSAFGLELVAALAVNVPGFPIPRTALAASAAEGQTSLVAAGIVEPAAITAGILPNADEIAGIVRASVQEFLYEQDRQERLAAIAPFIEKVESHHRTRVTEYFQEV